MTEGRAGRAARDPRPGTRWAAVALSCAVSLLAAAAPGAAQRADPAGPEDRPRVEIAGADSSGVSLTGKAVRLGGVLDRLQEAGLQIAYSPDRVPGERRLRLEVTRARPSRVLTAVAGAVGLRLRKVAGGVYVVLPGTRAERVSAGRARRRAGTAPRPDEADPVRVAPIRVEVDDRVPRLRRAGFYERRQVARRESGWGHFLDAEEINGRGPGLAQVLRTIPGLRVGKFGGRTGGRGMRDEVVVVPYFARHQGMFGRCFPAVYVDGARVVASGSLREVEADYPGSGINSVANVSSVVGIEVYPSASSALGKYRVRDVRCGLIAIWIGSS